MGPNSVTNLETWREGIEVVKDTYAATRQWPRAEIYALVTQAQRAAVSIPANLAEGVGRASAAEMSHFAKIALGSLYELDTLFVCAAELGFDSNGKASAVRKRLSSLSRRISKFIRYQDEKRSR